MHERRMRALRPVLAMVLVAGGLAGGVTVLAGVQAAQQVPVGSTTSLEAPDQATAMRMAYKSRTRVEITSLRTETSRTFATPEGSLALEQYADPQRVRRGTSWVPIDTDLQMVGGAVVPVATVADLRFSAGGTGPLVTMTRSGASLSLNWRSGPLPVPSLGGNVAKYIDVLPGVDMLLTATADSFSEVLVVKTRAAAQQPALARIAFGTTLSGVTLQQDADGMITGVNSGGQAIFASDGAAMWDSSAPVTPQGTGTGAGGARTDAVVAATTPPGEVPADDEHVPTRFEKVPVQLSPTELAVIPSQEMLTNPATNYPVYIDPSFNGGSEIWTHVSRKSPGTSYWTGSTRNAIRVGQLWRGTPDDDWRAFVQFNTNVLNGTTIISASFLITADHTADCAASPVQLWEARGAIGSSYALTWNNTSGNWLRNLQTVNVSANESDCPKPDDQIEFGNANVKDLMQDTATLNRDYVTFGLRAPNEGDQYQWKKFVPGSAFMDVVYNHQPGVPNALGIDSCYSACASPAVVRSGTPTISARALDADGGTLRLEFEVFDNAKAVSKARSGSTVTGVPVNTVKPWRVVPITGAALPDATYHFRVRGCDAYECGDYSGWFTFTVDTVNPSLPTINSVAYPPSTSGAWSGGPGTAGSFSFSANGAAGNTAYVWSLNGGATTTVTAGQGPEQLTANQQQVSTDMSGFTPAGSTIRRVADRGHSGTDSLEIAPAATLPGCFGTDPGCSYAAVGPDWGGTPVILLSGRQYRISAWIYVPAATGLSPASTAFGQRIVVFHLVPGSTHVVRAVPSAKATVVDAWQQLSLTVSIPASAGRGYLRLFNGFAAGQTTKVVYFDDLSVREVGFSNPTITPNRDGVNVLSVQALDAAGNRSDPAVYQFLVRPVGLSWYWGLAEGTGTTAASAPANNRPGTIGGSGAVWTVPGKVGAGAISMEGLGDVTTASPVLDTAHAAGFTVAAWVRSSNLEGWRTVLSQDGANASMFRLGSRSDLDLNGDGTLDRAWCFTLKLTDLSDGARNAACTTDYVMTGDWVHLVGIYDRINGKIKLYVNGTPAVGGTYAEAPYTNPWSATGKFGIGRAWYQSAPADRWFGEIDEVYADQRVWSDIEIIQKAFQ